MWMVACAGNELPVLMVVIQSRLDRKDTNPPIDILLAASNLSSVKG